MFFELPTNLSFSISTIYDRNLWFLCSWSIKTLNGHLLEIQPENVKIGATCELVISKLEKAVKSTFEQICHQTNC